ncbi:MAG: DUF21 domain-containing protein [Akkermansiaceae bacterium]|nr:DUF21 domain-containing protein [Akkermansiaceae bacterium]NNM30111.1 DUF21 domain-containing protein [Akkermansiaceae bacterium]
MPPEVLTWIGIVFCLSQSAMFSGLNLGFFSVGRLRLEAEAEGGNKSALKILRLRKDANFLLCTILWGNVSVNVLLALLSDSVMTGVAAFVVSTVGITMFGEIIPQAYFTRHAMRMGSLLAPVIRIYQVLLFVVAKPSALLLDGWIGEEGPSFLRERDMEIILRKHIREEDSEIGATEGRGALNFLSLDDRKISTEGAEIDPETIFAFPTKLDLPIIPAPTQPGADEFVEVIKKIAPKWAIITDEAGQPKLVLETDAYLCRLLSGTGDVDIYEFCHRPVLITDVEATLDQVLNLFVVEAEHGEDHVVDRDVILFWKPELRRIVTGADILGRLLQGIARRTPAEAPAPADSGSTPG